MKIGVVGLGLIGGSIFKNLSSKHLVIGISRSVKGENITTDYNALKNCDVIFVCTPMNATLQVLDKLNEILSPQTIVTDVCSIKSFLTKKTYSFKFIPSHPMAGTEHSGWDNSDANLFNGAKWAITPLNEEVLPEQDILESLIKEMGADAIITSVEEHDKAVALISHMPMVVAQALCENIRNNKLAQTLASTGFKDTTRLALSNIEMANDMVCLNKENIDSAIDSLNDSIANLLNTDYFIKSNEIN